jgi:alkylation response protein AidB-like acyl-CoA dehydrogenase
MEGTLTPSLPLVETDEHRALRESVRGIASRYGIAYMMERTRAGEPPRALWDDLADHGFLGVNIPEQWDGGGLGLYELAIVEEELSAAGCPLFPLLTSPGVVGTILARHGTPEQRERFLRGIGSGREHYALAFTEADAGSNSHRIATRARRTERGYVLSGQKTFISGIEDAARILVVARAEAGLSAFIVDVDTPGLERQFIATAVRMADQQWTLFFDDVEVDADRLIGGEGDGLKLLFDGLNPERILAAAIGTGIGRYALEKAAAYARERIVWNGTPIGAHQGVAHPLAEARIAVDAARLMAQKAAVLHDAGADAGEPSNMAKLLAADAALRALDQAIQTHGGNGLADEYGLADLWFSARLLKTAPVSREMILNYVAQHSLGLPRSY